MICLTATAILAVAVPDPEPEEISLLNFLVVPVFLCTLFLDMRSTNLLLCLGVLGMALFAAIVAPMGLSLIELLTGTYGFIVTVSSLMLLAAHHRDRLEKDRQETLHESAANLAAAQRIARLGSWQLDLANLNDMNANPLRWSDEVFRIFGYEPGQIEVSNENFFRAVHPDDREKIGAAVATAVVGQGNYSIDHRIILPDGSERIVHEQSDIVYGERTGRPIKMVGTVQDITEQYRAALALQRYTQRLQTMREIDRAILAAQSPDAVAGAALPRLRHLVPCQRASVVLFDQKNNTCQVIAVDADREFGLPLGTVLPIEQVIPPMMRLQGGVHVVDDLSATPKRPQAADRMLAEGTRSLLSAAMIVEGNWIGALTLFSARVAAFDTEHRDIAGEVADQLAIATHNVRLEQELAHYAGELEQRVRERTAQIEAANHELESFSYSVSHDLRAPLRAISGFAAALVEDFRSALSDTARQYLDRIQAGTQRMNQLVDDLLKLSRVTRKAMTHESVDLAALARGVISDLQKVEPDRLVEVVISDQIQARGDSGLLGLALENLLGNAWKFTSNQPRARIEFSVLRTAGGQQIYYVRDDGAGFETAYAEKMFGPFQRFHSASEFPGTGIGLATVQRVIRRHGGWIWAESAVNRGATFYFTLEP
jgi:PAS domain S-box-containing protein